MDLLDSADIFVFHHYDLLEVLWFFSVMRSEAISLKIYSEAKHITSIL